MSVLCPKPYDLESDYLPYLLLYKRTYLDKVCAISPEVNCCAAFYNSVETFFPTEKDIVPMFSNLSELFLRRFRSLFMPT